MFRVLLPVHSSECYVSQDGAMVRLFGEVPGGRYGDSGVVLLRQEGGLQKESALLSKEALHAGSLSRRPW